MNDPSDQLVFPFGTGDPDSTAGVDVLGGKGASLAEMSRAGFPVPPGFTISTACCRWVEDHDGQWPVNLEEQVHAALARLEAATNRTYGSGPRPLFVAVRSGAAVSMPGMMDTILNCGLNPSVARTFSSADHFWHDYSEHIRLFAASVAGIALTADASLTFEQRAKQHLSVYRERTGKDFPTDPFEALRQSINAVFASWSSERAVVYRQHHDVRGVVGTAVNVQAMFPSERSGVLFTLDPNNPASGQMILEASWGLGEAVVSGAVTPDIYALDATTFDTVRETPGSRPGSESALSDGHRREIAELGRRIVAHFGVPSDIEWGIADGRVALLQTRKIRGLDVIEDMERGRLAEIHRLQELATSEPVVWVVHNLSETLPAPTPLTWDLVRWFMSAQGGYGSLYRMLGHSPQERERGKGFLELIAGRIYVDPRRAAEFHFGRMPFEYNADDVLRDRTTLDRPPTRFNFDRTDSLFFFRLPALLWNMLRGNRRMKAMSQAPGRRFQDRAVTGLNDFLAACSTKNLCDLSTSDLMAELYRRRDFVLGTFAGESLVPGFFGGIAHERLRQQLVQLFGPEEGETLASRLTTGLEGDVTVEQNCLMADVAAGRRDLSEFIATYGHRCVNEMELSQPRWCEDVTSVERMIERFRSAGTSPRERHAEQIEARRRAEADLPHRLVRAGGSFMRESIEESMRQAQQLLPYRELGKYHLMRGYQTLRAVLLELGRHWNLGRDLFFLEFDEVPQFETDRDRLRSVIESRKTRWRSLQKLSMSDLIDSRQLDNFGHLNSTAVADQDRLPCRAIASGAARGTARIVFDPNTALDLGRDYILVCPSTDPGWTPLFVNARGLIVERGGVLSHGAIVARDFGIPAVVLEGATARIPDGALVELDANTGSIAVLSQSSPSRLAVSTP